MNGSESFVFDARKEFAEVDDAIGQWLTQQGNDHNSEHPEYCHMIEVFANVTTTAIRKDDKKHAKAYLEFVSRKLRQDPAAKGFIDPCYVEVLMYGIKDEDVLQAGWRLMPANIRALYESFWGQKGWMK